MTEVPGRMPCAAGLGGDTGSAGALAGVEASCTEWDAAVLAGGGHLLQSWRWGELKARHGWRVERVAVDDPGGGALAQALYRHRGPFSLGYVPRGPVVLGGETGLRRLFDAMDRASRRHRALALIVESDGRLPLTGRYGDAGFVRGPEHVQPSRTVKVPLLDDEALLDQMHQKTRYNVRLARRRGVGVERAEPSEASLDRFYDLLRDTSERNEFAIHARAYYADFMTLFGEDAVLMFAIADGATAAGMVAARFGEEAIYMYGASSTRSRAHGAGFYLQFEAMRWARDVGCTRYDLWGIPPIDPPTTEVAEGNRVAGTRGDDWRGLYEFKVRFGGDIVTYPPTLERRYRPFLATVARKVGSGRG